MEAINLTLGNKLELELYNSKFERIAPILVSQFEALLSDGTMEILAPIHEGRLYPVHRDTFMDVIYERNGDLFKFLAVYLERKVSGNIYLLRIQPRSEEERLQRRTFFRFSCLLNIKYRSFEHKETKSEGRGEFKETITKDLSGGGICLLVKEKPRNGWFLEGIINVGTDVRFIGRIVRVNNVQEKGIFSYEVGVVFDDIKNMDRERIIGYIFDSQRKLLKKGWSGK